MLFLTSTNFINTIVFVKLFVVLITSHYQLTMVAKTLNLILFLAITTVVTIAEILKNNGLATEKSKKLETNDAA